MPLERIPRFLWTLVLSASVIGVGTSSFAGDEISASPTNNDGAKWRIAYYEGGPYNEYREVLSAMIGALMQDGWIEPDALPEYSGESTGPLWQWLSLRSRGKYLDFVEDAFYSADWVEPRRPEIAGQLLPRLKSGGDIDLVIAMGTVAGQDLANDKHATPTMVLATSDPIAAGVIKSIDDSGFDHVHGTVNPRRFERQVRVFHDFVAFKTLGMFFEDSFNGRAYSGVQSVEKVAAERDFEVVICHIIDEQVDDTEARNESVKSCFEYLANQVEAIYVSQNLGVNEQTIPDLVRIAHDKRIPTFSQSDSSEVKDGFLLSLAQSDFKYIGEFHAQVFAKILNGALPRQLSQVFDDPIKLALNMKTAEIVGFYLDAKLLAATDERYVEIGTGK